jgi:tetratricopeptide (TPR) repeat protein
MWIEGSVILAVLLWAAVAYFMGGNFLRGGRQIKRREITAAVDSMFDTEENIRQRMEAAPQDPVLTIKWADLARYQDDPSEAMRRSERVIQRFPRLLQGYILMARALWSTEKPEQAYLLVSKMLRQFPEDGELHEIRVAQARDLKDWRGMLASARFLRKEHWQHFNGFLSEFEALMALGRTEEAAAFLVLTEAAFPDNEKVAVLWDQLEGIHG